MQDLAAGDREHDGRLHVRRVARRAARDRRHRRQGDPSDAARQAGPASRRDAAARARAPACCPVSRCARSTPRRRTCRCGWSPAASARGSSAPTSRLDPEEAQRRRNRLARGRRLRQLAGAAGRAGAGAGRHLQGLRGRLPRHSPASRPRTSTPSPGSTPTATCGCSIVVGRPLPSDAALAPLARRVLPASADRRLPARRPRRAHARRQQPRTVRVGAHADEKAELLRAAICDDEVLQAIGRGRGVNRSADDPLEVHVLADVALPLVHDEIARLGDGAARPLPAHAAGGHRGRQPGDAAPCIRRCSPARSRRRRPSERADLSGQNPIRDLYREMSA